VFSTGVVSWLAWRSPKEMRRKSQRRSLTTRKNCEWQREMNLVHFPLHKIIDAAC
jgi:hypothetical protein